MNARASFAIFFAEAEPLLNRALSSAFGPDLGSEATSEALSYGWTHWHRLAGMDNPRGYLYRVGEHWALKQRKHYDFPDDPFPDDIPESNFEPGLADGLNALSPRQRQVVVLVHGFGYTHTETAALLGLGRTSVQNHVERGMSSLRMHLGVQR